MGKTKKSSSNKKADGSVKVTANKILTKDGKVKKKISKRFTDYQCEYCTKKFKDKSSLNHHVEIHFNLELQCQLCSYVGKSKRYLAAHMRHTHRPPTHMCHCGKAFTMPSALREHAMVHTGEKPHKCGVCGKAFRVAYSLNSHMLIHTNEKPFKCSFCEYACRDSSTLRKHEHRHMGCVKTYDCKICPKKFESKCKLKHHISSVHLNYLNLDLKKHKCEYCDKKFYLKNQLRAHIEYTHDPTQACDCPICGRKLKHKRYLELHLRTHFPERPHSCGHPGCGKRFKAKGDLKKHSIIHQPHLHRPCPTCGVKFSRAERLVKHMRTHEPREKSVICDYCGVAFYTKNYLIKHITQKHCKEKKKYICDKCDLVTYNKPSLVMHIKYGECREEDRYCKICKFSDKYKTVATLRTHYLTIHKMRYKPIKRKKKIKKIKKEISPVVDVKMEPVESDPFEEVQISYLDVKDGVEIVKEEDITIEDDVLPYSNSVLSEELQDYLMKDELEGPASDDFDACLVRTVFNIPGKQEAEDIRKVDTDEQQETIVMKKIKDLLLKVEEEKIRKKLERKERKKAKLLEKKLRREAKLMRAKKRREKYELERVRLMYNDRMKRAVEQALNERKEPPKKITYFKKKVVEENINDLKNDDLETDLIDQRNRKLKDIETNYGITSQNAVNDEIKNESHSSDEILDTLKQNQNDIEMKTTNDITESLPTNFEGDDDIKNIALNYSQYKTNDSENESINDIINETDAVQKRAIEEKIDLKDNYTTNIESDDIKNIALNYSQENNDIKNESINDIINETDVAQKHAIEEKIDIKDNITTNIESDDIKNMAFYDEKETESTYDQSVKTNVLQKCTDKEGINTNDQTIITNDNEDSDNQNIKESNSTDRFTNEKGPRNVNNDQNSIEKDIETNELRRSNRKRRANKKYYDETRNDNSDDDNKKQEDSHSDDNEQDSAGDAVPNKNMCFKTFQCYTCFKLFSTKSDQLAHCSTHFDICSSTNLSKCPVCGFVASVNLERHMKQEHDMDVCLSHDKITERKDGEGSKYCFQLKDTVVEIIPSVKKLNYQALKAIDKKKREKKDMTVAKTKLVKRGNEWMLEKVSVDASAYQELPQFTDEELSKLPVSSSYTERLGQLGRLARSKGIPMLYPCHRCDKICQVFAALRLHERRHDPDKKPFAPRKNKRDSQSSALTEKPKVTNLEHRVSKPQPIKNKHRCDDELKTFYETHIRGDDIEFWQFLKIFNKMDRDNINDFKDLEGKFEFGIHTPEMLLNNEPKTDHRYAKHDKNNEPKTDHRYAKHDKNKTVTIKNIANDGKRVINSENGSQEMNTNITNDRKVETKTAQHRSYSAKNSIVKHSDKFRRVSTKMGQPSGKIKPIKRVVLLSRAERKQREKLKMMLRDRLKSNL